MKTGKTGAFLAIALSLLGAAMEPDHEDREDAEDNVKGIDLGKRRNGARS